MYILMKYVFLSCADIYLRTGTYSLDTVLLGLEKIVENVKDNRFLLSNQLYPLHRE